MASEQLSRRENTTTEREIHVEKDRVPKMTTHFEHLSVKEQLPQGSIEALQGGEINKDHAGKAIGDIGGTGKARETHELGSNFHSLSDINKKHSVAASANVSGKREALQGSEINKDHAGKARETHELRSNFDHNKNLSDRDYARVAASANVAGGNKEREGFGGVRDVGKFQMETKGNNSLVGDREKLDARTKVVTGKPHVHETKTGFGTGQVVAEKGRMKDEEKFNRGKVLGAGNEGAMLGKSAEQKMGEEKFNRGKILGAENESAMLGKSAEQRARELEEARNEEMFSMGRRFGAENEAAMCAKSVAEERERAREKAKEEEEKRSTLEEISKYRFQAQESAMEAISAAQERYEKAKQATNETAQAAQEKTAQAMEKAAQAKNATIEKTQQGYEATKETVSNAAKTAAEKAAQAKDAAIEKSQQGYEATKDTVSSAAKTAQEYVTPAAEKAKSVAVQAKDVTVEKGKTAAEIAGKVAVDLKDKATAAGWTAAHLSTQLTVEGTKAAAHVVEGAGHKAAEIAAKSVDAVKGLAASAGETAKEYTARKKEESWREYEAKRASQLQGGEEIMPSSEGIGENMSNYTQKVIPSGERTQPQGGSTNQVQGKGSNVISNIGETVGNVAGTVAGTVGNVAGNVAEKVKKPFENMTSSGQAQGKGSEEMMKKKNEGGGGGGSEILGAVTETVSDIGNNMIKATGNKVQNLDAQSGGVLDAIGETIAEIAQTTKAIVVGEGDEEVVVESKKTIVPDSHSSIDRAKHEGYKAPKKNV